ncbi:Kelch-like protein 2 [Stylophora pistillata]|uniref:Kelch-like protein 2 n=1 Tax=Stylophora pistillata TaxID=50429 RepID=A0A2B4S7T5_STYPI|nr:Kelch-like protein 2 [Stylophora pistillata]
MDDLPPITVTEQNPFCLEMMKRLNIQRKQGHLCDITLITKDDQEFKAHRNVLSAASPFFCKLLQSDMKENREGVVRFEEISGSVMEDILEFIYTGTVKVTKKNAEELAAATNYLIISNLKTISVRYLQQQMCKSNYAIKLIAFSSDDDLSQSFHGCDTRAIVACGGEYPLCYVPQEDEWKELPNRLSKERLDILSTDVIRFRDQLFLFCNGGQAERYDPLFNGWSSVPFGICQDKVTVIGGELFSIDETFRRLKGIESITKATTTINKFHVESCSWQKLHSSSQCYRKESCVIGCGNFLYLLGGKSPHTSQYVSKTDRFDITKKKWEEIAEMQQARGGAFGVAIQEKIFVAGGADEENAVLKTCEVYNVSTNEWQLIANLNVYRTYGSMVCLGGTLYVLGGFDQTKKKPEYSVECYDSKQGKWILRTIIPVEEGCKKKPAFKGCVLKFSRGVLDYLDDAIEEEY